MPETGSTNLNLVAALLMLHKAHGSGVVRVERGSEKKQFVVRSGSLAFAESSLPDDHLACVLVKMNLISRACLPRITALIRDGKTSAQAILAGAKLAMEQLLEGGREQAVAILASLFEWEACEIRIYSADGFVKREFDVQLPLPTLLVLAARRAVADRRIPASLKTLQGTLSPAAGDTRDLMVLPLDSAEALAYSQIREPTTLEAILPFLPAGVVIPAVLVQRLLLLGLIRLDAPAAKAAARGADSQDSDQLSEQLDELLHRFEVASLYEILSVAPGSTESEIKDAYHELAKRYHPDRFQSQQYSPALRSKTERLFTYITGAYTTLSRDAARASYDEARLKKESKVEAALQARSAVNPDQEKMAETLFRAGRTSQSRGEFEQAVQQLKECVWLRPNVARYRHYLGKAQAEIPRMRKEAERQLLKAIELDGTQVETYLVLGKLYLRVNLPARAEAQLQEALRWDPDNLEARRLLGELAKTGAAQDSLAQRLKRPFLRS